MKKSIDFDVVIQSNKKYENIDAKNISELLFLPLAHRDEDCDIIWSHDNEKFLKISLKQLRYVVSCLFKDFQDKKIVPGDTVFLADLMVNNVFSIAVMFIGLAAYGCRVMLPMWVETKEMEKWIKIVHCKALIIPGNEINKLNKHQQEKQIINTLKKIAECAGTACYDVEDDFNIRKYLSTKINRNSQIKNKTIMNKILKKTTSDYEIAIFTTSGTSGKSKLVVYDQKAYLNTISSYQSTGLYNKGRMGGRSFIDIFTHSVSIRCLINALWTGQPVCMVTSDWVKNRPEKLVPLLIKMKPEVITLGPSSFGIILDFIKLLPEIKKPIFSELKTIVSTGAPYSKKISNEWKKHTGLTLDNAYGLVETQQFTSTILNPNFSSSTPHLGTPFSGVHIGLKKCNKDVYKLYVKTVFGHKYIINPANQKHIYPEEFYYSGDLVRIDNEKNLYFVGREKLDFIKNGYGAKIPLSTIKKYYKNLYHQVNHIQYYPSETKSLNLGIAALIFVQKKLSPGRIIHNKTIKKYKKIIKKINKELFKTIEPFEYEHRSITRFLLINSAVPKTCKNTVSKYKIDIMFKEEISDLKKSNEKKTGVAHVLRLRQKLLHIILTTLQIKNTTFRKYLLRIIMNKKSS